MSRPHRTQRPTARSDAAGSDASNPAVDSGAEVDERLPDLDEQSAALSADLVRVYLNEIGKVALLNAEQEVELSKRIEAGLYADHLLFGLVGIVGFGQREAFVFDELALELRFLGRLESRLIDIVQ